MIAPPPPKPRQIIPPKPARKEWFQVLKDVGYPTDVVIVDFESFFDGEYGLKDLSTIEYVQDKRFEILGCGFLRVVDNFPDYENQTVFTAGSLDTTTHLKWLQSEYGPNLERCTVVAHNASFDCMILSRKFGINPPHIIDTVGLARHWNARDKADLATLAKRFNLPDKGETEEFMGMTFRPRWKKPKGRGPKMPVQMPLATDEQITKLASYGQNDVRREWELFTILLPRLSNPKIELQLMQHTLDLALKPSLQVDSVKCDELIGAMQTEVRSVLDKTGLIHDEISGNKSFEGYLCQALMDAGDVPQRYFKVCKTGYKLADAKTDPERDLLLKHSDEKVRSLMEARAGIKSWPTHISRLEQLKKMAQADGGLLPIPLRYMGAHTGRWSGSDGVNFQNFGSRGHELINSMREVIVAPEGKTLVIADAAQIEARVLAWVAGQKSLIEAFAQNRDVYCEFGTEFFRAKLRKPSDDDIPAVAKLLKARRQFSKICVLGMGYGMGPSRFMEYAGCDADTAERAVDVYRSMYPDIPRFWYDNEKSFIYTAKHKQSWIMLRNLRFDSLSDCDVMITLPNGRELKYISAKLVADKYGEKIEIWNEKMHSWQHSWGGEICENVVQAMSRDILAEAMLRLESATRHTAFHVHDELIMVVDEEFGSMTLKQAIAELSLTPTWAPGCPLAAEGTLSKRYKK